MADVNRALQDALGVIGITLQTTMKKVVSTPGTGRFYKRATRMHRASAPGHPPTVDTGQYRNSIQVDVSQQREPKPVVRVGTNSVKGPWLEFGRGRIAPRPHWIPTLRKEREKLVKLAEAVIAKRLKAVR
jgi:hypothetical protein